MKMAMALAAVIPPITALPITWREIAPAPVALQSGTQPKINAKEVIRMGRRRSLAPSRAASAYDLPFSNSALANSTIKMAFLAASPISMIRPICA